MSVYLDYNATTPIDPRVLDEMIGVYKNNPGNADSRTHDYGENARVITETARKKVAALLGVASNEIIFTSGATESNNIAIQGLKEYAEKTGKKHIITTAIEHKAVLNTVKYMGENGFDVEIINPNKYGRVSADEIIERVRDDTLLVSVMHVNNETGVIQPVQEIGERLEKSDTLFHVDATQSCGKLIEDIKTLKYDMLSFSAHKFRGPQGIGVLVLRRKNYKLPPVKGIIFGGQQEHGIRPGTTPVALAAGMGKACELAAQEIVTNEKTTAQIKTRILKALEDSGISYEINGDPDNTIDSTLNICFPGISSEALMISSKQYCAVSNGSACTSKSYEPSYVLVAMGLPEEKIQSSIRISWGGGVDPEEVVNQFSMLIGIAKGLS